MAFDAVVFILEDMRLFFNLCYLYSNIKITKAKKTLNNQVKIKCKML